MTEKEAQGETYQQEYRKQSYTVYHCTDLRAMSNPYLGQQEWAHHRQYYVKVAEVVATSLDEVFGLTNHVGGNWQDNVEVKVLTAGPLRSTSVGDVIVPGDDAWLVEPAGFTAIVEEN